MKELTTVQGYTDLQDMLEQLGFGASKNLIAMHLAEIEEEADRLLDLLLEFRAWARQGESELADERLAGIYVSLTHLANHTQAVVPLLDVMEPESQESERNTNSGEAFDDVTNNGCP